MHDSAVPRVSPAPRHCSSTSSSHRALVAAEDVLLERLQEVAARARPRARSAPGSTTKSTWISKSRAQIVTSTPSPSPPASASAFATADSLTPNMRSTRRSGSRRAPQHPPHRLRLDARAARAAATRRAGPGSTTTTQRARVEHDAGSRARDAERDRTLGQRRLLAHARGEIRVRASHPLGEAARDPLDLGLERLVDSQPDAGDARDELDRPVVVRRPEPAGDEADVGLERLAQRRLELGGVVADDRDAGGLQPEPERLLGIEGAVQVAPLAPYQLAARHDDGCARARQELGAIVRCPFGGHPDPHARDLHDDVARGGDRERELLRREPLRLAPLERAAVERLAGERAGAHLHERGALRGRDGHALRDDGRAAPRGRLTPCTFGSVGPPNFHAAITSAVRSTIAATAIATSRDSCRSLARRRGRDGARRV